MKKMLMVVFYIIPHFIHSMGAGEQKVEKARDRLSTQLYGTPLVIDTYGIESLIAREGLIEAKEELKNRNSTLNDELALTKFLLGSTKGLSTVAKNKWEAHESTLCWQSSLHRSLVNKIQKQAQKRETGIQKSLKDIALALEEIDNDALEQEVRTNLTRLTEMKQLISTQKHTEADANFSNFSNSSQNNSLHQSYN